ncbi:hypothetical protein [Bradyrhizobium sp. USDA 4454]
MSAAPRRTVELALDFIELFGGAMWSWKVLASLLGGGLFAAFLIFAHNPAVPMFTTAIGMVVVAIFVAIAVVRILDTAKTLEKRVSEAAATIEQETSKLGRKISEIKKLEIYRFSQRDDFNDDYWKEQIEAVARNSSAKTDLVLVGRTLEKWVEQPFSELFANAVISILRAGGTVRMLTLDPNGEAGKMYLQNSARKDLARGIEKVDTFIERRVRPNVSPAQWKRLDRRQTKEVPLTFTMFRSDTLVWVSPYLSIIDTSSNLAIACGHRSPVAVALIKDVDEMWNLKPRETTA